MAYGAMRTKPATKFGAWLDDKMYKYDMSAPDIANKLHCSQGAIYHHRTGIQRPTFSDIVAYCWVFKCFENPEEIWKLVDIPNEE